MKVWCIKDELLQDTSRTRTEVTWALERHKSTLAINEMEVGCEERLDSVRESVERVTRTSRRVRQVSLWAKTCRAR